MQRVRRLASAVVVASLAVVGLSACRSEPSVAAYVGASKITEDRVEAVFDEAHEKFQAAVAGAGQAAEPAKSPLTRVEVVGALLGAEVLSRVAQKQNLTLPADLQLNEYASSLRLPPDAEYVRLFAQTDGYVAALRQKMQNAPAATDADLREVFDVLVANQQVNASGSFDEFKKALPAQNKQLVDTAAAVRKEILAATSSLDVRVNPRYQPVGIPVLQFQTQSGAVQPLISARLGADDTTPVTDLR